jgi:hypothetical protein
MLKQIGTEKWITKYCAAGKHYVVATPEHFRVVDKKLTADCKECEARQSQRELIAVAGHAVIVPI